MDLEFKGEIKSLLQLKVNKKIDFLIENIATLKLESSENGKSSAGDKHEVGRAMSMAELERLNEQLSNLKRMLLAIDEIQLTESNIIGNSSMIKTNHGTYQIGASYGKLVVQERDVFVISTVSPLAMKLRGKKVGDELSINGVVHQIEQVV